MASWDAHLGSDEDLFWAARVMRLDAYPNFAVDTGMARNRHFARGDRDWPERSWIRYQDRILYATDFPCCGASPPRPGETLLDRHERDWAFFSGGEKMDC